MPFQEGKLLNVLKTKEVLNNPFTEYCKKYEKNGGYTRILKFDNRKGGNASIAIVVLT